MDNQKQMAEAYAAFAKAQSEMRPAKLNKINPHFKSKYADLQSVIEAVSVPLTSNGFSYPQKLGYMNDVYGCNTEITHSSGVIVSTSFMKINDTEPPQKMGSGTTYARRYTLAAACGISADEDDDGNVAEQQHKSKPSQSTSKPASVEQIENLQNLLMETGTNHHKLFEHMGIEFSGFDKLDDTQATGAIALLNQKKAKG